MSPQLSRRAFGALGVAVGLDVRTSAADARAFRVLDIRLEGASDLSRRAKVLVPSWLAPGERAPVLVLLHGLGETANDELGVNAWVDRYGLLTAHARLSQPPLAPIGRRGDLSTKRARALSEQLQAKPFDGRTIFVCPYLPNIWRLASPYQGLDRLARWTVEVLLPEVRSRTPAHPSPEQTAIDGCSLGGFAAFEVFLRQPASFAACGGVQAAISEASAARWADRFAAASQAVGPRALHIETSRGDAFFRANVALSRALERRGVVHELAVLPGPHDQPWLREVGTLEMLLWHDRRRGPSPL